MNWNAIVREDQRLRAGVDNASEALARHRYDHTIAAEVSFREYARRCGLSEGSVRQYARAWEVRSSAAHLSISDALVRASTSAERADVIEAIAEERGVTPKAIQAHHGDEVRRVEGIARERAVKQGTTVREEASRLAETAVRQEKAERSRRTTRRDKADLRYLELERHVATARRSLGNAAAVDARLDDEHRELLRNAINAVRELLGLIEMRFIGAADVDWDAELARLDED
jgi:hypothetical protein